MKNFVSNSTESTRMFSKDGWRRYQGSLLRASSHICTYYLVFWMDRFASTGYHNSQCFSIRCCRSIGLDVDRIHHAPICFSLSAQHRMGQETALYFSWRSSRLSQRCQTVGDATVYEYPFGNSFLFFVQGHRSLGVFKHFFASFLTGYLCYDMFHYAFHHGTFSNPILKN